MTSERPLGGLSLVTLRQSLFLRGSEVFFNQQLTHGDVSKVGCLWKVLQEISAENSAEISMSCKISWK